MAIAYIQGKSAFGTDSATTTAFSSNTTSGNTIIVVALVGVNAQNAVLSVTDSKSNTYTRIRSDTFTGGIEGEVWYTPNISGGASHTVTGTIDPLYAGTDIIIVAQEFSGLASSNSADKNASDAGTSTSMDSGNTTTTSQADELIFGALFEENNSLFTIGSGFSNLDQNNSQGSMCAGAESKVVSSTGQYNATATFSPADNWRCTVVTFKAAATTTTSTTTSTSTTSTSTSTSTTVTYPQGSFEIDRKF